MPTRLVVVDASALVSLLGRDTKADAVRQAIGEADMVAPDLINAEVLSVLRRDVERGDMSSRRAAQAVRDLREAPLTRLPTLDVIDAAWSWRANATAYDGMYVGLAARLGAPVVTCDVSLSRAPGVGRVRFLVVT